MRVEGKVRGTPHVARHHRDNRLASLVFAEASGVGFTEPFPTGVGGKQRADCLHSFMAVELVAQAHVIADAHPRRLAVFELL
ncbi:hypothetical protein D3C76_1425160 [compost metagenome]